MCWFQSTPPRGRRPVQIMPVPTLMCFNPRPHARGDTRHLRLTPSLSSFNPRPHARGDVKSDQFTRLDLVSIHAPTRGATFFSTSYIKRRMFQSTPPREGRQMAMCLCVLLVVFQSTPPHEGRQKGVVAMLAAFQFQSTPPRGGRQFDAGYFNDTNEFQSTPPRGGRPIKILK